MFFLAIAAGNCMDEKKSMYIHRLQSNKTESITFGKILEIGGKITKTTYRNGVYSRFLHHHEIWQYFIGRHLPAMIKILMESKLYTGVCAENNL